MTYTCPVCKKEISFNQWHRGRCQDTQGVWYFYHTLPEADIRRAYDAMLTEAAYSRTQP